MQNAVYVCAMIYVVLYKLWWFKLVLLFGDAGFENYIRKKAKLHLKRRLFHFGSFPMIKLTEGSGYFFHVKMPGYRLASLAAATTLHFTAFCIQLLVSQNPTACIAYLGGSSRLLIRSTGAIILS